MSHTIGIDVGGTKIAAAAVDSAGAVGRPLVRPTPAQTYPDLLGALADVVAELSAGTEVTGVGLAIAGNVRSDGSSVLFSPHLPLADQALRDDLSRATGLPVTVANDADAAAWAEFRFGGHLAPKSGGDLLMVALGTGLGSGLVLGGELYRGAHGFAGEAGHLIVVRDGRPCPCGSRGCLERYASGSALHLAYAEAGGEAGISGPGITERAVAGEAAAMAAYREVGDWLGVGLASLVAVLDPEVVVIGGGLASAGPLLTDPAGAALSRHVTGGGRRPLPPLVVATLGSAAGLVGAAALAAS